MNYSIEIFMKRVMLQAQQCLGWIFIHSFIYLFQLGSWELIVRFSEEHNLHFKELGSTCVNQPYAATVGPLIIVMCARRWLQPHCTRTQLKVHGKPWRNLTLARVDRFIAACEITRSWEVTQKCPVDALKKINESFHVDKLRLFHHEPFTLGRRGTCLVQLGFFRDFFFFLESDCAGAEEVHCTWHCWTLGIHYRVAIFLFIYF